MEQIQEKEGGALLGCGCEETVSHQEHDHSIHGHRLGSEDTTGHRLLITLSINLLIPAAQVAGSKAATVALRPRTASASSIAARVSAKAIVSNAWSRA